MLARIRDQLKVIAPDIGEALLPPASEEQIEALQSIVDRPLPEDLVALYQESAGLDPDATANFAMGFSFMGVEAVAVHVEQSSSSGVGVASQFADKGICPVLTLGRDRVAIGTDFSHCRLCVDLIPTADGTYGQVICIDEELEVALLLAPSVAAFLQQFEQDLAGGKYGLAQDALDDGVQWLDAAREIDVGNWYNSPTWSYVDHPNIRQR